jgi:ATP-dependent DNA ligase
MGIVKPRYLFPQHPKSGILIAPQQLGDYEAQGLWLAQLKFQGSNSILWVYNDQFMIWNRQGEPFTNYRAKEGMAKCIKSLFLEPNTEYVFNGELLHTKAKNKTSGKQAVTDTIVLFDILFAGRYLFAESLEHRLAMLTNICLHPRAHDKDKQGLVVANEDGSQIWMAETFYDDFEYHFWKFVEEDAQQNDRYPLIEGLMLKRKGSTNVGFGTKPVDVTWMTRCRKRKDKTYTL